MTVQQLLEKFEIHNEPETNGDWTKVVCPFHPDEKPSGSISLTSGGFKCFVCEHPGDVYDFLAANLSCKREAILALTKTDAGDDDEPISDILVDRWHKALLQNPNAQKLIATRKGINLDTIKQRKLGMSGDRFTVPIYSADKFIVNVRQWSPTDAKKKMINLEGHSPRKLYPIESLEQDTIYITEGELKALLLIQLGFRGAIGPTGGASTWSESWNELFRGKHVIILYDIDEAGRTNALKICHRLAKYAKSIKNVVLPLDTEEYPRGDVTDFIVQCSQTADDLRAIIEATPPWVAEPLRQALNDDPKDVTRVSLSQSSEARHYNKFVEVECVASGKFDSPYIVPKSVKVACMKDQVYCAVCPIFNSGQEHPVVEIDAKDPALLELCDIKIDFLPKGLKKAARIPSMCDVCVFQVVETYNIEEVRLIPQLKISSNDNEHVVRRAFYVGHGMETNVSYLIKARVTPEPNRQHATLLIYDAKSAVDSLSTFQPDEATVARLQDFACAPTVEAIEAKLTEIYDDLEANVTQIFCRRDLHLLYDLTYHSVLNVPFQGRSYKGWVESLVVGDSGQGKSETITRLIEHYQLGEKVDCKGATTVGLLGGLSETSKRWFISWGVITLNDRRFVALEEAKGLPTSEIAKMTEARSSGIITLSKVEKAKTMCRCRLAWISNPRSQRQLSTYNYGVEAIKELIGSLEDIRRFDLACVVASGDVPRSVINAALSARVQVRHRYTTDNCRDLLLWAWSRKVEDVSFTSGATSAVLKFSEEMGQRYSSAIPLVEAADHRLKLARLSAALAARVFSSDPDGHTVVVREAHVEVVVRYLDRMYSTKSFGYKDYSQLVLGEAVMESVDSVVHAVVKLPHACDAVKHMLDASLITASDLMDWTAITLDEAKELVGHLVRKRALKRYRSAYVKTPAFVALLKDLKDDPRLKTPAPPGHIEEKKPTEDKF